MKIEGDRVIFRSDMYYYGLEKSGNKSNTVRLLNITENEKLDDVVDSLEIIRIENSEFGYDIFFERELTNVEQIGELVGHYLVVFSWKHREDEEE